MSPSERILEPEALFQAHVQQLIAWIKGQLKSHVQSTSPRPKHPYSGPAHPPAASVKDGRVIVTYYEGDWLQPIDVFPAPGANAHGMADELQQAFLRFQPREPEAKPDGKPPPEKDRPASKPRTAFTELEDYFEANPRISRYDQQHNHALPLPDDLAYRVETSADGLYVALAIRWVGEIAQYHLKPSHDVRASVLRDEIAGWLAEHWCTTGLESQPLVRGTTELPPATATASELSTVNPTVVANADQVLTHVRGLREHLQALRLLGCTQVSASLDGIQLTFPGNAP